MVDVAVGKNARVKVLLWTKGSSFEGRNEWTSNAFNIGDGFLFSPFLLNLSHVEIEFLCELPVHKQNIFFFFFLHIVDQK